MNPTYHLIQLMRAQLHSCVCTCKFRVHMHVQIHMYIYSRLQQELNLSAFLITCKFRVRMHVQIHMDIYKYIWTYTVDCNRNGMWARLAKPVRTKYFSTAGPIKLQHVKLLEYFTIIFYRFKDYGMDRASRPRIYTNMKIIWTKIWPWVPGPNKWN